MENEFMRINVSFTKQYKTPLINDLSSLAVTVHTSRLGTAWVWISTRK